MEFVLIESPMAGVAIVRLNRPQARNALNSQLRQELAESFDLLESDNSIRSIVITGDDKAFAAGADLREIVNDSPLEIMDRGVLKLWSHLSRCSKPIIAAVRGAALGGGCELALQADIIIAGRNALFGQPELKVGIMPGGGATQRLMRSIGKYQAMMMILTGEPISGQRAAEIGLASEAVEDDAVMARAIEIAGLIATLPPVAVRLTKEAALAGADAPLSTGLLLERRLFEFLFSTQDQKEGMTAFAEKRSPKFRGK
jgi:enoyl-CoA hydratase